MTLSDFISSLEDDKQAPQNPYLLSLWLDGRNDWEGAHEVVQDLNSREAAHIHAYLHRKEGDRGNAAYWYSRAKEDFPTCTLKEEWKLLVEQYLLA